MKRSIYQPLIVLFLAGLSFAVIGLMTGCSSSGGVHVWENDDFHRRITSDPPESYPEEIEHTGGHWLE